MYTLKIKYENDSVPRMSMPNSGDWGIDLYSNEDIFIPKFTAALVDTGVRIQLPEGFAAMIKDRSSKSKYFHTLAGVIDNSYRGVIKVRLFNHSEDTMHPYNIHKGERIAQLLILPDYSAKFRLHEVEDLTTTSRGDGGFGSTGV